MKRKLVEIFPEHYRRLQAIRREALKEKRPIPSMPFLVNQAIEHGVSEVEKFYRLDAAISKA